MRCISLDFPDNDFVNPAYAYKISVGYILSDCINIMGHTITLLGFETRFQKMTLLRRAEIVAQFQTNEPEAKAAFDQFFKQQRQKNSAKHLPTNLFLLSKKLEMGMEKVITAWSINVRSMIKEAGFFSFSHCFDIGILENYYMVEKKESAKDRVLLINDIFSNKAPIDAINKAIWLLAEGFYNEAIYEEVAITDIDLIEEGKPYLIKCLDLPNLNTLTSPEMCNLKNQIHDYITLFKAEAELWATKCYTEKNGVGYFKEKVIHTMQSVQNAVDNDSILKQWASMDAVKRTSAIYFGEVTPPMLWKYYKNALLMKPELFDQLMADYELKESYTIPVMVFAYNKPALKLETEPLFDEAKLAAVLSVKKYFEV